MVNKEEVIKVLHNITKNNNLIENIDLIGTWFLEAINELPVCDLVQINTNEPNHKNIEQFTDEELLYIEQFKYSGSAHPSENELREYIVKLRRFKAAWEEFTKDLNYKITGCNYSDKQIEILENIHAYIQVLKQKHNISNNNEERTTIESMQPTTDRWHDNNE